MAKRKALRDRLDALDALRAEADPAALAAALKPVMETGASALAAKAAGIAADAGCAALAPSIAAAFDRFMTHSANADAGEDKGCRAKIACADALRRLWHDDAAPFLAGARHRQMEPVFGGREDTAAGLRAVCVSALAEMGHHETPVVAGDLLADPLAPVRIAAAHALGGAGIEQGEAVLRLKVLLGDEDLSVTQACMEALLAVAPSAGPDFVAGFLESNDESTVEAAALALGGMRGAQGFERLHSWYEGEVLWTRRRAALLGIALCRHEAAIELLLDIVRGGADAQARDAVRALAVHAPDTGLRRKALDAAAARNDDALNALIADSL